MGLQSGCAVCLDDGEEVVRIVIIEVIGRRERWRSCERAAGKNGKRIKLLA